MTKQIRPAELIRILRPEFLAFIANYTQYFSGVDITLVGHTINRKGNVILLYDGAGALLAEYPATQAGLIAALGASGAGDRVELPTQSISLTTGITIPAGVTLGSAAGYSTLLFAGFTGIAITLSAGSALQLLAINYDGAGFANAQGIEATALDAWSIQLCAVYVHDATANNIAIICSGSTAVTRSFIEFSHFHGNGGSLAVGIQVAAGGNLTVGYTTGLARAANGNNYGLNNAANALATEAQFEHCRFDADQGAGNRYGGRNTGYGVFYSCIFNGVTTGFVNSAGARVCDCTWSSLSGTVTYLIGDRGAYSVEDYHANDIETGVMTRHLPLPDAGGADDDKIPQVSGTSYVLANLPDSGPPIVIDYSEVDVDNPPTKEQITSIFGLPNHVGPGYLGMINDDAAALAEYIVASDGYNWLYMNLTKAIATVAAAMLILASDTFTDADGTSLDAHTMDVGSGWTEETGSWEINSNTARQLTDPGGVGAVYMATTDLGQADFKLRVKIKPDTNANDYQGGLIFRWVDANNHWLLYFDDNSPTQTVGIYEVNGGVYTVRDSKAWQVKYSTYIELEVECSGNDISAWVDGGYGLSYNSSFSNTATKAGIWEYQDPTYESNVAFEDFNAVDLPAYSWTRQGTVLAATVAGEQDSVYEPSVIWEGKPKILTGDVFKLWYSGGGWTNNASLYYAESNDGLTFTKHPNNPILANVWRGIVQKWNGIYYYYGVVAPAANQVNLYTSPDGITWTLDTAAVLTLGAGGSWDDYDFGNVFVWREAADDWRMMYESRGGIGDYWRLGYATSPDGVVWTKSGSNPVLSLGRSTGGPWVRKVDTYYYLWCHMAQDNDVLPTWIYRFRSTNLTSWTPYPYTSEVRRQLANEGEDSYVGQVADAHIVEANGVAWLFFDATADGSQQSGDLHIEAATADPRVIFDW